MTFSGYIRVLLLTGWVRSGNAENGNRKSHLSPVYYRILFDVNTIFIHTAVFIFVFLLWGGDGSPELGIKRNSAQINKRDFFFYWRRFFPGAGRLRNHLVSLVCVHVLCATNFSTRNLGPVVNVARDGDRDDGFR